MHKLILVISEEIAKIKCGIPNNNNVFENNLNNSFNNFGKKTIQQ